MSSSGRLFIYMWSGESNYCVNIKNAHRVCCISRVFHSVWIPKNDHHERHNSGASGCLFINVGTCSCWKCDYSENCRLNGGEPGWIRIKKMDMKIDVTVSGLYTLYITLYIYWTTSFWSVCTELELVQLESGLSRHSWTHVSFHVAISFVAKKMIIGPSSNEAICTFKRVEKPDGIIT